MSHTLYCPRCGHPTQIGNSFCAQCSAPLYAQQPPTSSLPRATSNSSKTALIVIATLFGTCMICGLIGRFTDKSNNSNGSSAVATNSNQSSLTPTPTPAPLTSAEKLTKAKQMITDDASAESLGQAIDMLRSIPKEAKEYKEAQPLSDKTTKRWARLAAEKLLLGPKPENSAWNGEVLCVDKYLKETLNDYEDAEYLEWSPVVRTRGFK